MSKHSKASRRATGQLRRRGMGGGVTVAYRLPRRIPASPGGAPGSSVTFSFVSCPMGNAAEV